MSLWERMKSWLGAQAGTGKALCIVDGAALTGGGTPNGRLNPKEQIQTLRKLSQFAEREGFDVMAVFEGRALREVAHGESFENRVKVYFADSSAGVLDTIRQLATDKRTQKPMVVVANRKFEEEMMALGVRILRANTLRKGVELALSGGGGEQQGRTNHQRGGERSRRRRSRRNQQAAPKSEPQSGHPPTAGAEPNQNAAGASSEVASQPPENSAAKPPVDDAVRSLIDLVE